MEKTGVVFEMTETFTLENMFAMELHKHTDVLGEIVTAAIKEVAIEKVRWQRAGSTALSWAGRLGWAHCGGNGEESSQVVLPEESCASTVAPVPPQLAAYAHLGPHTHVHTQAYNCTHTCLYTRVHCV